MTKEEYETALQSFNDLCESTRQKMQNLINAPKPKITIITNKQRRKIKKEKL